LVMLRDPIERAHSAWRLRSSEGRETLTFADTVAREQRQPALVIGEYHEERKAVGDAIRFLYLAKSRYAEQLERWLELFPLEQFAVVTSEDLFQDPDIVLTELSRFLGIPVWDPAASFPALNETTPAPIDPGLRQDLADYFAPHNRQLEALLGRDFGWN
ncbi:MAG: sulfotransferase domain-containing protein, partial [Acidimicrobiia bacterium]